jgi:hypothetical protein
MWVNYRVHKTRCGFTEIFLLSLGTKKNSNVTLDMVGCLVYHCLLFQLPNSTVTLTWTLRKRSWYIAYHIKQAVLPSSVQAGEINHAYVLCLGA